MNSYYNQNYNKKHITAILQTIQDCIRENHYTIAQNENRQGNIELINNYNLTSERRKQILLKIKPEDFCHSLKNTKLGFEHEILYVFCPQVTLFNFDGDEELIDIYTKFNIIDIYSGKRVVVISFHKRNKPIDYLLR